MIDLYELADEIDTRLLDIENKLIELHVAAFNVRFDRKAATIGLHKIDGRWRLAYALDPPRQGELELTWNPISNASIRTRLELIPLLDEFVSKALLEADEIRSRAQAAIERLMCIHARLGEYHVARASEMQLRASDDRADDRAE